MKKENKNLSTFSVLSNLAMIAIKGGAKKPTTGKKSDKHCPNKKDSDRDDD